MQRLLIDIRDVAAALGVSRRTAYVLRKRPEFQRPITLAHRVVRYRATDMAMFVERLTADAEKAAEPAKLKAGRARKRGSTGGPGGGSPAPMAAKPRPVRRLNPCGFRHLTSCGAGREHGRINPLHGGGLDPVPGRRELAVGG